MQLLKAFFLVSQMFLISTFANPKTWDHIFNALGEGDYASAKIEGAIRFTKYVNYPPSQTIAFKVNEGVFNFAVTGDIRVSPEELEAGLHEACNETKEVWLSHFYKPKKYMGLELVTEIKGIDLACGNELYAIRNLKLKFPNKEAQNWWTSQFETIEKNKRDQLALFRIEEQEHKRRVKAASEEFTDPRDGQTYRIIEIEGRKWYAQNANYAVDGESFCYDDKDSYCERSGRLYTLEGARKACPKGWHLPRDREWQDMLKNLTKCYDGVEKCGDFGHKLKAKTGWQGGGGSDEYGFTVYSSGYRAPIGSKSFRYVDMGVYAGFWSAQNGRNETIWLWAMGKMSKAMVRQLAPSKNHAYSVRCIDGD